jgi:small subunit ribosomal protein S13
MVVLFGLQFSETVSLGKALMTITGLGRPYVQYLCRLSGFSPESPLGAISREQIKMLMRRTAAERLVLSPLRRDVSNAIKLKIQLRLYQGIRHLEGLPVRGQNTKANARTSRRLQVVTKFLSKA